MQMNGYRLNNINAINNLNNMNNIDEFISNQGYFTERTKSPRRVVSNMAQNQFFQANDHQYQNFNRIQTNRDMSPNKIANKRGPLLPQNNMVNNPRVPPIPNNFPPNFNGSFFQKEQNYGYDLRPPHQNNIWKNLKSPRSPQQTQVFNNSYQNLNKKCYNHAHKKAQYMTQTQGEIMYYCESCAAKLAANNFEVSKLPTSGFKKNIQKPQKPKLQYKRRQIPSYPEYKGNPVYESIVQFLKEIFTVEHQHYEGYEYLEKIDQHYEHQIEIVNQFYLQIEEILLKMHQDHLADIEKQHIKHSQMKDIYMNDIRDNLESINDIIKDLDESFQTVVTEMTKQNIQYFNNAIDQNRIQVRFYRNKVEQQKDTLKEIISYKEERLEEMIGEFEKCLTTLWEEPEERQSEKYGPQKAQLQNNQAGNRSQAVRVKTVAQLQNGSFNASNMPGPTNNVLQPMNRQTQKPNEQKFNIREIHQNSQVMELNRDFVGKGAFRQIFNDQDEKVNDIPSPVFPKI